MKILFIDPSINNIGWAVYDIAEWRLNNQNGLITWGTYHPKTGSVPFRVSAIAAHFSALALEHDVSRVVLEALPEYTRGGKNTGSLLKLARAVGALESLGIDAEEYAWKARESKDSTGWTVKRLYPQLYDTRTSNHALDAVMMGHRWLSERRL